MNPTEAELQVRHPAWLVLLTIDQCSKAILSGTLSADCWPLIGRRPAGQNIFHLFIFYILLCFLFCCRT